MPDPTTCWRKLGPTRAAKKLGYSSLSGYLKALARARAEQEDATNG